MNSGATEVSPVCNPCIRPTATGVPMAPNDTGLLSATRASVTAAIGRNPSATRSGAVTAAGVPKPAAPSRNAPKSQAITMTCTRGSGEMRANPRRIAAIAPPAVRTLRSRMAPNTIQRMEAAISTPSIDAARTRRTGTPQAATPTPAVRAKLNGIAAAAGRRNTTRRTRTASSGVSAARIIVADIVEVDVVEAGRSSCLHRALRSPDGERPFATHASISAEPPERGQSLRRAS